METEVRDRRERYGAFDWPDLEPMFTERLAEEDISDATVLDLGTGEGRLALLLAPRAKIVVGIDTDANALAVARENARSMGITNATFLAADADAANYRLLTRSPIDVVVASHFMSEGAVRATAKGLRPGGRFVFVCHHRDHWIETGRVGHFSFDVKGMRSLLEEHGLAPRFLGVDRLVVTYADLAELATAHPELREKFRDHGRWSALESRFGGGPARLTWSVLVGVAQA